MYRLTRCLRASAGSPVLICRDDPLPPPEFRDFRCYVYGNEARGLPREALAAIDATAFTIAGTGAIESLNVATTVNICQYVLARQRGPEPGK